MIKVIGVRFRTAGKIYFFDPLNFDIKRGDHVVVETARGIEYGTVMSDVRETEDDKVVQPLKPVIRLATEHDDEQERVNKEKEKEAYKICLEKIRKHGLEMKLIDAEYTFDNNKVLFYFTADGRIDFRELVKDLASVFKTRIELRQIGVRDETKIVGGIGICGRPLCCHSYLSDFVPVSIKMAKEQNLSLNPTKISGVCGRLMCCLKNEEETYEELNRRLPNVGDYVTTEDGLKGEVQSVNVLRQLVKVIVDVDDEKEIHEYEVDKLRFKRKHGKRDKVELSKEEMRELERLEQEDAQEIAQETQERRLESHERKPERHQDNHQDKKNERADFKGENHQGDRVEGGSDNKPDGRHNRRQGGRRDNRTDNRQEERRESRQDNRQEERRENRQDNRQEERRESRQDNRQEERRENRQDNRQEERRENRQDGRQEERRENRQDNRQEERRENRQDGRQEERRENRQDNRQEERQDNRQNRERRNDGRPGGRRDGRHQRRGHQDDRAGRKPQNHDNQSEKE